MLILTRKIGEEIVFPEYGISVMLTAISSMKQVKLGIVAPKTVKVIRGELHAPVRQEGNPERLRECYEGAD